MLLIAIRSIYAFVCAGAILTYVLSDALPKNLDGHQLLTFFIMLAISQVVTVIDILMRRKRIQKPRQPGG